MNRERHQNLRPADKKPNEKYGLVLGGGGSKGMLSRRRLAGV